MPYSDMNDDALMLAYARGNTAAFDALYQRYERPLLRFVRRLLGQAMTAQAEEVFQEAWLRIIAARENFRPQQQDTGPTITGAWKAWAFTIAHNAAMDRLRISGREIHIATTDDGDDPLAWLQDKLDMTHPSSEDVAFWRAAGQQLLHCLEQLPINQRAAFLLHHEDHATVEDLARRLALPFETAKSRLRYALQKLRGCMQAYLTVFEVNA